MSEKNTIKGILLAVLSCFLWGSLFIFARYLLRTPAKIDPYLLVFLRFLLSAAILFAYTDIQQREAYRHHSFTAEACIKCITGKGLEGYALALEELAGI